MLAFTIPLLGAGTLLISQQAARVDGTQQQELDLEFVRRDRELVHALRRNRDDLRAGRASGSDRLAVDRALFLLERRSPIAAGRESFSTKLADLSAQWVIAGAAGSVGSSETALRSSIDLGLLASDRTTFAGDLDAPTEDLLDAFGSQIPMVETLVDKCHDDLLAAIRSGRDGDKRTTYEFRAAVNAGRASHAYSSVEVDVDSAQRYGASLARSAGPSLREARAALATFLRIASEPASAASSIDRMGPSVARVLTALEATSVAIHGEVARRLIAREADERRRLWLFQAETVLAVFVTLGIAILLARTIVLRDRHELARARSDAERLASELVRQREIDALMMSETQLRAAFDRSSIGVAIIDHEGRVARSNEALREMLEGSLDASQVGAGHPSFDRLMSGAIEFFSIDLEARNARGLVVWLESTISLVRDDLGTPRFALAMLKDVTERKRTADRLRYEASHDPLSGLPNRTQFIDRLRATFFGGRSTTGTSAVLFVDLDEFKFVNDSLGHAIGDRVLVAISRRLQGAVAAQDVVARFGGDEFAMLLLGRRDRPEVERAVSSIGRAIADPLLIDGREIFMTASIGVALADRTYGTVEHILRDADTAMYYAKTAGRSRHAFFDRDMHEQAARRLEIATQLRRALERDQFYLAYQPVVSFASGAFEACESLLRWEHPQLGSVPPAEFIPIAEEIGMIVPIGRFVMDRACAQLRDWRMRGVFERSPHLSVNASVREVLQVDYPSFVESMVERYAIEPGQLTIEVTESTVLASGRFSSGALDRIKAAGVGLSIDDFGTGYSSLRYLQQFPFDEIKIDRSFVSGADGELASEAIVSMLLSLGRAFEVNVTAEGVETPAQAARLRALGCTRGQGYLYGKAVRAEHLGEFFRRASPFAS